MQEMLEEMKRMIKKEEKYVCPDCKEEFTSLRALGVHKGRWCPKKIQNSIGENEHGIEKTRVARSDSSGGTVQTETERDEERMEEEKDVNGSGIS